MKEVNRKIKKEKKKIKKNLLFIKSESFIHKNLYLREITFLYFNSNEIVKDITAKILNLFNDIFLMIIIHIRVMHRKLKLIGISSSIAIYS